ncbi:MAG: hypothetical protein KAT65_30575, partial [Methanophagales archaeon]|nr:hypothetical protein [Methanophagales archaeon]
HIVEEDPQVIIYSSHGSESLVPEQIKSAELKTVDAVKNNRIYPIDEGEISRPGPRIVNATEIIHGYIDELLFDPWRYDINGDGIIEKGEVIDAVRDYFNDMITKEQVIEVIKIYFR